MAGTAIGIVIAKSRAATYQSSAFCIYRNEGERVNGGASTSPHLSTSDTIRLAYGAMVNSNYFNNFGNREGDFMTFEQIVTYIITPLVAGLVTIFGAIRWVIPRLVESYLKRQEQLSQVEIEVKKSTQEEKRLALEYSRTEATEAQRMLGDIISDLQKAKEKDDDFLRSTVFSFERRLTAVETKTRLLVDLLTKGLLTVEETIDDDYEAWKKSRDESNQQPSKPSSRGGGNDEAQI